MAGSSPSIFLLPSVGAQILSNPEQSTTLQREGAHFLWRISIKEVTFGRSNERVQVTCTLHDLRTAQFVMNIFHEISPKKATIVLTRDFVVYIFLSYSYVLLRKQNTKTIDL